MRMRKLRAMFLALAVAAGFAVAAGAGVLAGTDTWAGSDTTPVVVANGEGDESDDTPWD